MNAGKPEIHLAIEFTTDAVKFVRLARDGDRYTIEKLKSISVPYSEQLEEQVQAWRTGAREILSEEKVENHTLLLGVNGKHASFSQFTLPKIPKKELRETLTWKMKDTLSFPIEEAEVDFRICGESVGGQGNPQLAYVSALPRSVVDLHRNILKDLGCAGVRPAHCAFSISKMPNAFPGNDQSVTAVVDIGDSVTEVALYDSGSLHFLRKLSFGGRVLNSVMTQAVTTERGTVALTREEATRARQETTLLQRRVDEVIAGKVEATKIHALIRPEVEKLINELKRSFDYYANEQGNEVEKVFVTGGSSRLKGLVELLQEQLTIPTQQLSALPDVAVAGKVEFDDVSTYYRLISLVLDDEQAQQALIRKAAGWGEKVAHKLPRWPVGAACVLLIVLLCFLMEWKTKRFVSATRNLKSQIENLQPGYQNAKKIRAIEQQILRSDILSSVVLQKEPLWSDVFMELSGTLPAGVILERVRYENNSLLIEGNSDTLGGEKTVTDLLAALKGPVFQEVQLVNKEKRGSVTAFTIRLGVS
jgi:type IV pilus assembly protein PilM